MKSIFRIFRHSIYRCDYVPERIFTVLGSSVKFIIILRNPVDRAYSAFNAERINSRDKCQNLRDAIKIESERIKKSIDNYRRFSYLTRGLYSQQVKKYLEYFPLENMHFVIFENFVKNTKIECEKIFTFLEIKNDIQINYNLWSNKPSVVEKKCIFKIYKFFRLSFLNSFIQKAINLISEEKQDAIRAKLFKRKTIEKTYAKDPILCKEMIKYFYDDIKELENLLGINLSSWIDKYSKNL